MVPVLSAFYFGSVEHYRLLAECPKAIIDIGEHYERQSYRTRTSIVGPNGKQDLVVQIARRSGEKMPMRSVGLSYIETWPQQHVHAIRSAYGNTPWFIHYIDAIEDVVLKKYDRLVDLDLATMRLGLKWLGLRTEVAVSEEYLEAAIPPGSDLPLAAEHLPLELQDLRTTLHPKRPLPQEITKVRPFPQVFADRHGFVQRMSVIDLVMNTGPEARRSLLA
ncbi:MAG: WbqC family protein [Flavobacteriales bacterium]|nr:WbqC family protein [Flavobacteriales bacterium]